MAQTVWYMPTGLDPWNQLLGQGARSLHAALRAQGEQGRRRGRRSHWPDQEPLATRRPDPRAAESLAHAGAARRGAATPIACSSGLMEDAPNRQTVLAHLAFAGLIDVQDRMLHNRSYTTGHKSYRARATIELGNAIGWDNAHHVLYAGVPDIAVGPRWYSTYEMGCNVVLNLLESRDAELLQQESAADAGRGGAAGRRHHPPARGARSSRRWWRCCKAAGARGGSSTPSRWPRRRSSSRPARRTTSRCRSTATSTATRWRWFFDTFEHPHRLKLLFVAASFVNHGAEHQRDTPDNGAAHDHGAARRERRSAPRSCSSGWRRRRSWRCGRTRRST